MFKNVKIYNYDSNTGENTNAAIGTCSHCMQNLDPDGYANTATYEGISFTNVSKRIHYSISRDAIIHDKDGSISGDGSERWVTPTYPHHQIPGVCADGNANLDNSVVCNKPVLKVKFNNPVIYQELVGQKMKIVQF